MREFLQNIVSGIGINDVIDILITAFIVYKILGFIRETRAQQLIKGLLVIVAAYFISDFLSLHTINWMLRGAFTFGVFALVVVFQPELRRALEYMGRSKLGVGFIGNVDTDKARLIVKEITEALMDFSNERTGALIVFERQTALEDIAETGTKINAEITDQMLGNIFYEGAPLHDGAVIIRGDKIYSAGCVLPLSDNKTISKSLGTRHRAGLGISEKSDALVMIVSEETGIISAAENGKFRRPLTEIEVTQILTDLYINSAESAGSFSLGRLLEKLGLTRSGKEDER